MNRPITETEKTIIGRDATEQKSFSAELNGRASLVGALFGLNVSLIYQLNLLKAHPIAEVFIIVGLLGAAFVMFWISRGTRYGYIQPAEEWVEWSDRQAARGSDPCQSENRVNNDYWRTLAKVAKANREANRQKAQLVTSLGPLSIVLICLVLLMKLIS